ncbi:hypothetical protein [Yinghuangia soli]|uniref:Uncharacterized protein n=1 Tax=Yinghuangia soli TaxID=2908204 RepID=A0AA41TYS3_9ACTN|nr:hypothetical protein [Yinghuangia soli]MCF2526726.1 hypothetical protein [Yinghuangia soli]
MTSVLRRFLLVLSAALLTVGVSLSRPAAAERPPSTPEPPSACIYVPEDWSGFEFSYYCKEANKEAGPWFNVHADYYVNISRDDKASTWDRWGEYTGQPCPREDDYHGLFTRTRGECLTDWNWTGIGMWMRGQDGRGFLGATHLLENIRRNPCDALTEPEAAPIKANCFDVRKTNPCTKVSTKEQQNKCNAAHPWFTWRPPDAYDYDDPNSCKFDPDLVTAHCPGTQVITKGKVSAPASVWEAISEGLGVLVLLVFIAGAFGLLLHLYFGVQSYRNGDTVAAVFGRMTYTLLACVGALGVTGLVWIFFNA